MQHHNPLLRNSESPAKFLAIGEIMLRLTPPNYEKIRMASTFEASYGGSEANIALALANLGVDSTFFSVVPNNSIGKSAVRMLRSNDVHCTPMILSTPEETPTHRIGTYYLETGYGIRASKVIYDRKHTAISEADPSDFNWDEIFADADWFHFTGITVALSENLRKICEDACIAAKRHGVRVSCDLNYRKTLWSVEEAQAAMKPLMAYVDVLIANEEDAEKSLGIKAENTDVTQGKLSVEGYQALAERLAAQYNFAMVAFTLRESISASVNNWSALLYSGGKAYRSKKYTMQIVDRVGGGDSFASGLIYACLNGYSDQDIVEFAAGASCLKHSIEYDFNLSTPEEVLNLIRGDGSGRVVR